MLGIPETIKTIRTAQGLKLRDVAALTGLSVSYLSDIETGRTVPTLETLCKIADALKFEISIQWRAWGDVDPFVMVEREKIDMLRQFFTALL